MFMGLGLIFYGMAAMGSAMSPLRTQEGFAELLQSLQSPVLGMLAGAVFTALVQSSSATIGLAVVMAVPRHARTASNASSCLHKLVICPHPGSPPFAAGDLRPRRVRSPRPIRGWSGWSGRRPTC